MNYFLRIGGFNQIFKGTLVVRVVTTKESMDLMNTEIPSSIEEDSILTCGTLLRNQNYS
jgi:hypothetical protein